MAEIFGKKDGTENPLNQTRLDIKRGSLGDVFRLRARILLDEFREGNTDFVDDQEFLRLYYKLSDIIIMSPHRAYQLWRLAKEANNIPGHFAELGVYKGGTAKLISTVKRSDKQFFLFDTFEGLPSSDHPTDDYPAGTFGDTTLEEVSGLFQDNDSVIITKGLFPESAKKLSEDQRFAFVHLDADLYQSNFDGLEYFYPRLSPGGVIVIDDFEHPFCKGIQQSTEDFLKDKPEKLEIPTKHQAMIRKSSI
jgi:hypothetical protein